MIDPVQRCENLSTRFEQIAARFKKLSCSLDCSTKDASDIDSVLQHVEGNEDLYEGAYWLEDWLFKHGV